MNRILTTSMRELRRSETGFTIVELMIATMIFSVILVVVTAGVISFTTSYYRGLNSSATQTAARDIASDIAQNIEYGGNASQVSTNLSGTDQTNSQYGCISAGNVHYNYYLGRKVDGTAGNYGIYETTSSSDSCDPTDTNPADPNYYNPLADTTGRELLGKNMRLTNITVTDPSEDPNGKNVGTVAIGIAYGDDDLLCSTNFLSTDPGGCDKSADNITVGQFADNDVGEATTCKGITGWQFCATTHLTTAVVPRLGQ